MQVPYQYCYRRINIEPLLGNKFGFNLLGEKLGKKYTHLWLDGLTEIISSQAKSCDWKSVSKHEFGIASRWAKYTMLLQTLENLPDISAIWSSKGARFSVFMV